MKKITTLLIFVILILFSFDSKGQSWYLLDFTLPSTYTYDCGKVNPPLWEVSNDSCTLTTTPFALPDTCGPLVPIPFRITLNQSGNLECNDRSYFWYLCDTTWYPLDTIDGCLTTYVIDFFYTVNCPAGKNFAIRVSFHTNHNTEKWQLRNNDIEVFGACPMLLSGTNTVTKFSVNRSAEGNQLYYSLNAQPGVYDLVLERSQDKEVFEVINYLPNVNVNYNQAGSFYDNDPLPGANHYRLRVENTVKQPFSSKVASINNDLKEMQLSIYPNPSMDVFKASIYSLNSGTYFYDILDISGKKILQRSINLKKGNNDLDIDLTDQSAGIYYLSIFNENDKKIYLLSLYK